MKTRILLIDDELRILETFARNLKFAGYTVLTAEGGKKGLRLYYQEQPDIILLDLRMPELSGLEVLQAMREHDPEVNVILVTGHADQEDVITALRAGASDLLSKPVSQPALESALRRAEERMQLKQKLRASQEALRQQNEQLEAIVQARTEELRKSEERYRSLFTNNHAVMLLIDPDTGDIVDANPAASAYYGYSKEELTARTIVEINALSEDEVFHEIAQAQSESRQHFLFRHRLANGEVRDVEVYSGPIWVHEKQLLYSIIHDITERKQAKDALRASEERFREIYAASSIGIEIYNASGELVDINAACLEIFGASSATDVMGFRLFEDPNLPEAAKERLSRGETVQYETDFDFELVKRMNLYPTTRSGTRYIDVRIIALGMKDGSSPSGYLAQVQDITEQGKAKQALQESEQRMELALKGADLGTWDWNIQTGEVVFNDRWAGMLGYRLDEIEPHVDTWAELIHPDDMSDVMETLNAHLEGKSDIYKTVHRVKQKSGEWVWILDTGRVIERDADGHPIRACGTHLDITDRVQAAEALRESEERYRLLAETTPDIIVLHDLEGHIIYLNQAGLDFAGLELSEAVGQSITTFISPKRLADLEARRAQRLADDETFYRYETEFVNRAGQRMLAEVHSTPIVRDGHVSEILLVARDITERVYTEEALRESQKRLRWLLESTNDLIVLQDLEGRYLYYNGPSHYGLESEDVLGKTPHDWFPQDIADLMMDRIDRVVANGESVTAEQAVEWQGELIWFSDEIFPVRDYAGDIVAVGIISHDITERKQTEEELALRRQLWDALMANTPDLVYFKDAHHGLIRASQAYADAVGVDVEELTGKTAADLWPHEAEDILADERRVLAGEPIVDKERIATTVSGESRWYLLTKSPIYQDGEVIGFFAVDRDITDWKRAEEARERLTAQVQDQARQLEQILVTVPEGVLLLDAAGHVMLVNPVAKESLAFLMGQDAATLDQPVTHLGDRPLTELLTSPPTKGLWHEIEWKGRVFEVIARPMEPARSSPHHVEGRLSNGNGNGSEDWVLLLRNVTQEREIQQLVQQQERLAAVGQLAAGIAHDFNNIIAVILLYTQMALNAKELPLTTRNGLETVVQQAQQAAALVEQILDFSRRAVLERRPMDLTPFLKEVVKLLERTVPENIKINLRYGLDEYTVSADPTRMQQVILNLIVNARDAMPEGGELCIDLAMLGATDTPRCGSCGELLEGAWVCIAVTDTGHGISPDALPHIFEPFFTTKEIGQGAGLGLAQVFGLVKRHDGHIDVTTRLGEGTTFTIYLPALLAHQPVASLSDSQSLVKGQGETILIVEDNAVLREALAESLALLDYCILEAGNGRQALDVLDQHAEDVALVLSDLVMPVMGGQALFHALRDRELALPVVMLSGHPMEEELEDLKAQGLTGWMLKPPDIEHLSQLLARTLEEAHEEEKD